MTRLSVNLNKIAVLRNSRGGALPSVVQAAQVVLGAGADGLTVHPRPDQRHITGEDVMMLAQLLASHAQYSAIEFNIEGNPFAPARSGYENLLDLAVRLRPHQVTFVPDSDGQLTSDHGFDLAHPPSALEPAIRRCRDAGVRVSLFVDADCTQVARAAELGAERVEIYTGPFAAAVATGVYARELEDCATLMQRAGAAGLGINAGHDLDLRNLPILLSLAGIAEVSIGHALINDALYQGLDQTVRAYRAVCARAG